MENRFRVYHTDNITILYTVLAIVLIYFVLEKELLNEFIARSTYNILYLSVPILALILIPVFRSLKHLVINSDYLILQKNTGEKFFQKSDIFKIVHYKYYARGTTFNLDILMNDNVLGPKSYKFNLKRKDFDQIGHALRTYNYPVTSELHTRITNFIDKLS